MKIFKKFVVFLFCIFCLGVVGCSQETTEVENVYNDTQAFINFSKKEITLYVGETYSMEYLVYPSDLSVDWSSSDKEIVSVENGVVMAKNAGTAKIVASVGEYEKSICNVTVVSNNVPCYALSLDMAKIKIYKSTNYQLDANLFYGAENVKNPLLSWSSSDCKIVSVDSDGMITTHCAGNANIIVEYYVDQNTILKAQCEVEVCEFYNLSIQDVGDKEIGDEFVLIPTLKDEHGKEIEADTDYVFSSHCDRIVKYSETDKCFVAVGNGDVELSVAYNGFVSTMSVHVNGISPEDFVCLSGTKNTGVFCEKNVGYRYVGESSIDEENCVSISNSNWQSCLQEMQGKGYSKVVFTVYSVDGIFSLRPFGTKNTMFLIDENTYIYGKDVSELNPYVCIRSLEECKKLDGLMIGMYGNGSVEFSIVFEK